MRRGSPNRSHAAYELLSFLNTAEMNMSSRITPLLAEQKKLFFFTRHFSFLKSRLLTVLSLRGVGGGGGNALSDCA